jgi:peroxiredoxin
VARSPVFSLALLLTALGRVDLAGAAPPNVGERHPNFTLANIADGKAVSLSDFRGKKVLLIQFASW